MTVAGGLWIAEDGRSSGARSLQRRGTVFLGKTLTAGRGAGFMEPEGVFSTARRGLADPFANRPSPSPLAGRMPSVRALPFTRVVLRSAVSTTRSAWHSPPTGIASSPTCSISASRSSRMHGHADRDRRIRRRQWQHAESARHLREPRRFDGDPDQQRERAHRLLQRLDIRVREFDQPGDHHNSCGKKNMYLPAPGPRMTQRTTAIGLPTRTTSASSTSATTGRVSPTGPSGGPRNQGTAWDRVGRHQRLGGRRADGHDSRSAPPPGHARWLPRRAAHPPRSRARGISRSQMGISTLPTRELPMLWR